jgi:hypothetical protein
LVIEVRIDSPGRLLRLSAGFEDELILFGCNRMAERMFEVTTMESKEGKGREGGGGWGTHKSGSKGIK